MELSLPAGNLHCAIVAYENGADSVYFGLKQFSARKGAENFSFDDARRLKQYAIVHNKKFYITLNTLISNEDIPSVFHTLSEINYLSPDGLIVQDFGIVNLCKKYYPNIPLHASTQMVIRSVNDVKMLEKLGFRRAVLARELSLKEIKEIREKCPNIELKVFIHGALCYCLSGRCYASRVITGNRSANKGDCEQVCRWCFTNKTGEKSHFFSLTDLVSNKETITTLKEIGIDAIKVEGRLKNSLYVKYATLYYRALIDNKSDEIIEKYKELLETSFSRRESLGYFNKENYLDINCSDYVGHRGYPIGTFISENKVKLTSNLSLHDGLLFFDKDGNTIKFPLSSNLSNKKINEIITLNGINGTKGQTLYRIKKGNENERSFNPLSYKTYLKEKDLTVKIYDNKFECENIAKKLTLSKAKTKQKNQDNFTQIFKTNEGLIRAKNINIINNSTISTNIDDLFIPLSIVKELKKDVYIKLNSEITKEIDKIYSPVILKNTNYKNNFKNEIKKIDNIGDLYDNGNKFYELSPYMNITNDEAKDFFYALLKDKLIKIDEAYEDNFNKNTPIFTSYANLPSDGEYEISYKNKKITLLVKTINNNKITYVI